MSSDERTVRQSVNPVSVGEFSREIDGLPIDEIVKELMRRADQCDDLNGFIARDAQSLHDRYQACDDLPAGSGALSRVACVIKDNIHVAGLTNTAGTPSLAQFKPRRDAPSIRRLAAAGVVPFGKANMHELALGPTSISSAYGPVRHPVDPKRFVGGSSGGTATLIAAGVAPIGLGTDTGGSVRIPAALAGICGLRPTPGRYPAGGITPLSWTRDTIGPMATTMVDIARLDQVLAGTSSIPTPQQADTIILGVPTSHFVDDLDEGVGRLWQEALKTLQAAGVRLVDIEIPDIIALSQDTGWPIVAYETQRSLETYLGAAVGLDLVDLVEEIASADVEAVVRTSMLPGSEGEVSPMAYADALAARQQMRARFDTIFSGGIQGLIFPTTRAVAGSISSGEMATELRQRYIRNTDPGSVTGLPGVTIPMGRDTDGMPAGLALDCAAGDDELAIAVSLTLERALRAG